MHDVCAVASAEVHHWSVSQTWKNAMLKQNINMVL
jgi:hypothetical protein